MRRVVTAAAVCVAALIPAGAQAARPVHLRGFELAPDKVRVRPDDGQADPGGTHKWIGPEAVGSPVCTSDGHFCVHWTSVGSDASTQSYAQQAANILDNEVYPCENGTGPTACSGSPGLGWRDAQSDFGTGGSDAVDVYIEDLYSNERVYGYTALDPGQDKSPLVPHYAYVVIDKDYSRYGGDATANEQVTLAHEYNHVLQNAYDYLEDDWMFEATAVYMEKKVYPSTTDYVNYVGAWAANPNQPLTTFSDANLKPYGSAVWNHWLDHRYGAVVVRAAWEDSTASADFAPAAYSAAIAGAGGEGFSDEFDRFSAAVAEWDAPGSGFPDHYPDVARSGTLPVGAQTSTFGLPHTTFALFDVPIPADAPRTVRLVATLPAGTAGAVALVGRTGSDPNAGAVTTQEVPLPSTGVGAVQLDDPAQFGRITAVVVNSDPSHGAFDTTLGDYAFTRDASSVVASMTEPGGPVPTTGPVSQVADHTVVASASIDPRLNDTNWHIEYGRSVAYGTHSPSRLAPGATIGAVTAGVPLAGLAANTTYHYRVVAANSAGVAAGRDETFKTAVDRTAPTLTLAVKRQQLKRVRKRGLVYLARCSERCSGTATVTLRKRVARTLGLPQVLGDARLRLPVRKASSKLVIRLSPRAKKALVGRRVSLPVTLTVRAADASKNFTHKTREVRLASR